MKKVGYSDNNLVQKLGYKPLDTVYIFEAPEEFKAYLKNEHVIATSGLPTFWAHGFFNSKAELHDFLDTINLDSVEKGIWFSWPKKSSGTKTDLTEQTLRDVVLPLGWVDTKVVAVDDTWSGLKFLRRRV